MPFSPYNLQEKDYNVCLTCVHIGKNCDGPNYLAMTTDQWCEWIRLRKEYLGWTNAHIAEVSGVSKVTIDRIMAATVKDLRTTTMQAVSKTLVHGDWGHYPCSLSNLGEKETVYVDNPELTEKLENEKLNCSRLRQELEELNSKDNETISQLRSRVGFFEGLLNTKQGMVDNLLISVEKKNRLIGLLVCILVLASLAIATSLILTV